MVKTLLLASGFAVAGAAKCSGSDDPVISSDTCYRGKAGALGLTETVTVNIHSYSAPTVNLDIAGDGIEGFTCAGKTASKSGQDITVDFGDDGCLPNGIVVSAVKYCSDQDTIKVTVKDKAVPLPISATLSKIDCSSAVESGMDVMFDDFKNSFNKEYNGDDDERKEVFAANVQTIIAENRKEQGFLMAVNQFADMTQEEFASQMLGRKAKAPRSTDVPTLSVHEWDGSELSSSVDWSKNGAVTGVKDQGSCGGCWSFAATGALEGANFHSSGKLESLSEQQFLDCDTDDSGCGGGLEYQGWDFFKNKNEGICTETSYPYKGRDGSCKYSSCSLGIQAGAISGISHVGKSANSLKSALQQQPIAVGIQADQSAFQFYDSGIMTGKCGQQLDHSVLAVGYEDGSYWKIKNSWGASWGDNGYIRIAMGSDLCGIYDDASYPTISSATVV